MRTGVVKRLLARLQAMLTAAALAEEGDPDAARRVASEAHGEPPRRP